MAAQTGGTGSPAPPIPRSTPPGVYDGHPRPAYRGFRYESYYIAMRDSTLLAADVFLPLHMKAGKKIPAILYMTRYVRSIKAKCPFNLLMDPIFGDIEEREIRFFTSYGYACVIVDVRGTGASLGARQMEFSPDEITDGSDIVDWIIAQPWSDTQVGATGISYVGTTAEMLLANQNPHVKACIPRSAIFDLYKDLIFPGGICQGPFVDIWRETIQALDRNDFKPFTKMSGLITGIHPVHGDRKQTLLKKALALHRMNFDITNGLQELKFRDDRPSTIPATLDDFSVHTRLARIAASGTPIFRIDGWYDSGLARGCLDASLNTPNTVKVLIGPWDHGPAGDADPYARSTKVTTDILTEMLRFFDHYLKGMDNGIDRELKYTYYTVGDEKWHDSDFWPPKNEQSRKMYLSSDRRIEFSLPVIHPGATDYTVDYTATSGPSSRWNSVTNLYMHGPTHYADRRAEDRRLLCFTSDALPHDMEVTGHPFVNLVMSADSSDATVFCYLEDIAPDSTVTYVTEGMMRFIDRKAPPRQLYRTAYPDHTFQRGDAERYYPGQSVQLTFDLLPISYVFRQGHSIRISIAGADAGHFNMPSPQPSHFTVNSSLSSPSYIEFPIMLR